MVLDDAADVSGESSAGARAARNVTLQTDKSDYQTGEVIVITGSGWDPGEVVTLLLHEEPTVHADRKVSVVADAFGAIFDNQFTQDAHDKPVAFRLIAKGGSSGLTTQAALAGNPSADLDQWANLNNAWVNGNLGSSKARYFEGDSIPYRLKFSNLSTTGTRAVTIEWDSLKGGKHALDYITTFNRSVPHVAPTVPGETPINPCAGVAGCNAAVYDAEAILPAPNGPASPVAGEFRLHGGFITSLSAYTVGASADAPTKITIFFTASVANPVLTWGGHIATRLDWGATNSAVSIPGSPYHTRLLDLDGSGGNQDRSLSADAVIFPARITIIKDVAGGTDAASFAFTTTGPDLSGFSLADNGVAGANTKVFPPLETFGSGNTRTVTETNPSPVFALTGLSCSSDMTPGGASANLGTRTATFVLAEGENVSCTFTNTRQQGTLRVIKHVVNNNGGTKLAGDFTLHVKSAGSDVSGSPAAGSESGTDYTLIAGTYVVSEDAPPSGYSQTGFSGDCDSGGSVVVVSGATKTCTITNDDQAGTLTVIKHVINDNGGTKAASDFAITVTGNSPSPANFTGVESPGTSVTIGAGSYSVDEGAHDGYTKTLSAGCSGTIANGESKTCTITNDDQAGTLTVIKHVINDNGGTKAAADFSITVTGNSPCPANFNGVESPGTSVTIGAGSYSVDEGAHDGYTKTLSAGCSGTIANGESKTCTITNDDQAGTLTVIKHVINDNGGTKTAADFAITVTGNSPSPANFNGVESPGTSVTIGAGTFSVDEGAHDGYTKSLSAGCSGTIANGESKTCTITNDDQAGTLTVIKHVINDNGGTKAAADFAITVTGNSPSPANFNGVESPGTSVTIGAGTYSVDEGAHDGYTKTLSAGCSGTIANGESKTCTVTNDDQAGTLTVIKHVINDNGGTKAAGDFAITVTGNSPSPASFNGVESPGTSVTIGAGTYSVDEGAHDGYTKTLSAGCSGTIANGESKTCTITNDDQAGTLTVIKHVINDNGGTKAASDFAITVTGNSPSPASFNGVESPGTSVTIGAGTYSVDEGAHDGYTKTLSAGCSGTIANGESKICTVTNDDSPAGTVVKTTLSWTLKDEADLGSDVRRGGACVNDGTITFKLYRYDLGTAAGNLTCADAAKIWESEAIPEADGDLGKANVSRDVDQSGIYLWVAVYSGDNCNSGSTSGCGAEVTEITDESPLGASLLCTAPPSN